jgi:hypothetical protein
MICLLISFLLIALYWLHDRKLPWIGPKLIQLALSRFHPVAHALGQCDAWFPWFVAWLALAAGLDLVLRLRIHA